MYRHHILFTASQVYYSSQSRQSVIININNSNVFHMLCAFSTNNKKKVQLRLQYQAINRISKRGNGHWKYVKYLAAIYQIQAREPIYKTEDIYNKFFQLLKRLAVKQMNIYFYTATFIQLAEADKNGTKQPQLLCGIASILITR